MKGLLFVYLLTYGGAILALFRPFYGLQAYMVLAVLRPDHLWAWALPSEGSFSKIVGIALLIGWVIRGMGDWELRLGKPILWIMIAYLCCIVASASMAINQDVAWKYIELHSKISIPIIIGMTIIESIEEVRTLAWTLVLCIGFLAYEAHGMYFGGRLAEFRDEGMLGMDNNSVCISMAAGAGLAIFLGFSAQSWSAKLLAFGLAGLMVHVPMFGQSRGGMLGVAVVGGVTFLLLPKRIETLATYAAGSLVALRLAGPAVMERFSTVFADSENRDASAQSRFDLWADCWDVMIHHPMLGIGPDHWPLIAKDYGWPPGKEAHSLWFNCGAELGFTGLGLLIALYVGTIVLVWVNLCRPTNDVSPELQSLGRMTITALAGFMVSASFVSLDALELPFYTILIGVSSLKLAGLEQTRQHQTASTQKRYGSPATQSAAELQKQIAFPRPKWSSAQPNTSSAPDTAEWRL